MGVRFNVDEILEMAETIEANGEKFYFRAAELVSDPGARSMLMGLAEAEVAHRKIFAGMRKDLPAREKGGGMAPPDEEMSGYLKAWADGQVFDATRDAAADLTGGESLEAILRMALDREKDSVVFYVGLKGATPKSWGREKIDAIIGEEMKHIAILNTEMGKLHGQVN